jgi:hypothetical protein
LFAESKARYREKSKRICRYTSSKSLPGSGFEPYPLPELHISQPALTKQLKT